MSEQIIIEGDCLEVMRGFADKQFDLVLTDPPYGISAANGVGGFGSSDSDRHYDDKWDDFRPSAEYFEQMLRIGKVVVIFGGNYFTDLLPQNNHWVVWDKVGGIKFDNPFSHAELAWTSDKTRKGVKVYTVIQQGFVAEERQRWHPTQKPVSLFTGILQDYLPENGTVLDPFMGSGTTLVAAKRLGKQAIGIEREERYCEIAAKRLAQEALPLEFTA